MIEPVWSSDTEYSVGRFQFKCLLGDYHAEKTMGNRLIILKNRKVITRALRVLANENISNIFEFGIFQGGSAIFWAETLQLKRMVAIDLSEPIVALDELIAANGLGERIFPHYRVLQTDRRAVTAIIESHFAAGDLDLIIDDASHLYEQTKIAFEIAFPYLKPGGLYIIEDWGWAHWRGYWQTPEARWRDRVAMSNLIFELSMATASSPHLIDGVTVLPTMAIVRKAHSAKPGVPVVVEQMYALRGKSLEKI